MFFLGSCTTEQYDPLSLRVYKIPAEVVGILFGPWVIYLIFFDTFFFGL